MADSTKQINIPVIFTAATGFTTHTWTITNSSGNTFIPDSFSDNNRIMTKTFDTLGVYTIIHLGIGCNSTCTGNTSHTVEIVSTPPSSSGTSKILMAAMAVGALGFVILSKKKQTA